jgi:hypothetical protein
MAMQVGLMTACGAGPRKLSSRTLNSGVLHRLQARIGSLPEFQAS